MWVRGTGGKGKGRKDLPQCGPPAVAGVEKGGGIFLPFCSAGKVDKIDLELLFRFSVSNAFFYLLFLCLVIN